MIKKEIEAYKHENKMLRDKVSQLTHEIETKSKGNSRVDSEF